MDACAYSCVNTFSVEAYIALPLGLYSPAIV
nr:MAG TPA: hypothetical protein [Caudoviricetes sp.]DAW18150.1 MAG TPA: hypothetical protein [Caudoviricetes sp.]DAW32086.1 MAG TPA: hypothetical protein [Caudoviricetes sp.]